MKMLSTGLIVIAVLMLAGLRVNIRGSVPYGAYWVMGRPERLERGMLVTIKIPESVRVIRELHGWVASWWPIVKPIAALPGDQVCLIDGHLIIASGSHRDTYGPVLTNSRGHRLPTWIDARCRMVPEDMVFVASTAVQSLDSRYFGPVNIADIRHVAVPLLTW